MRPPSRLAPALVNHVLPPPHIFNPPPPNSHLILPNQDVFIQMPTTILFQILAWRQGDQGRRIAGWATLPLLPDGPDTLNSVCWSDVLIVSHPNHPYPLM